MRKRIIVLATSAKRGGYCVAGINTISGEWIRLVSDDSEREGAVPPDMLVYDDGTKVAIYDIIEVILVRNFATNIQPENYLYDTRCKWIKVGTSCLQEVIDLHGYDFPEYIFGNGQNCLSTDWKFNGEPSLLLLKIPSAYVIVKTFDDKKKASLIFEYRGIKYEWITISQTDVQYRERPDARYTIKDKSMVFSLTDKNPRDGKCYKLVAQILE